MSESGDDASKGLISNPEIDELVRELNSPKPSGEGGEDRAAPPAEGDPLHPSPRVELESVDDARGRSASDGAAAAAGLASDLMQPVSVGPVELEDMALTDGARDVTTDSTLARLLDGLVSRGGTDLHLISRSAPVIRVNGELQWLDQEPLSEADVHGLLRQYLDRRMRLDLERRGATDLSLRRRSAQGAFRFRVNVHRQRGQLAANIRALPQKVPSLEQLNLPASLGQLVEPEQGLVLVCGPTGSGKSSTLAALVALINAKQRRHIITIEEPIEYEHRHNRSLVEQIEIGIDAPSFHEALRAALRQDPDVILLGEMRDLETMSTALTAAETGHLILSTLHTSDAAQAVHRIVDVFPAEQQGQVRQQLALCLHALLSQRLMPRSDGHGRVPALELLLATYPVRQHIRSGATQKIYNELLLGQKVGMISLEASLANLVNRGLVDRDRALVRSSKPEELESLLRSQRR